MVQVLPYVPGFGERLAPALEQAASSIGGALMQKRAMTALQKLESQDNGISQGQGNQTLGEINQIGQQSAASSRLSPIRIAQREKFAIQAFGPEAGKAYGNALIERDKLAEKEASQRRLKDYDRRVALTQKDLEKDIGRRESIRKEREDLKLGLNAVESGEVGGFDVNWLAERFGAAGEPLKNVKGVQLESAMKNLLVDSLQKTSGRPNQWIEQQIKSASASIGKNKEANETIIASGLAKLDVEEKLLDTKDELLSQYEQGGITPPSNLDKIVHDLVKPYAQQVEDKLAYDMRVIYERSKGESYLNNLRKVPKGTPLTLQKRDALLKKYKGDKQKVKAVAEKLGYTIPSANVVLRQNEQQEVDGNQ